MSLELASTNGGSRVTPTTAEIWQMDALQIMATAMAKIAIVGRWEQAAGVAADLAKYTHRQLAPIAPAAADDEEQPDCRCN
jgi:hypothetical protein